VHCGYRWNSISFALQPALLVCGEFCDAPCEMVVVKI
jgi:hypothetical protein